MSHTNKTLNCPNCRKPIPIHVDSVKVAGCPECGAASSITEEGYLRKNHNFNVVTPDYQHPFFLGTNINFNGQKFKVYAIYIYYVEYTEWDKEDAKWVNDNGYTTEWYARSITGEEITLVSDTDDKNYIVEPNLDHFTDAFIENQAKEIGTFKVWGFAGSDSETMQTGGFYRAFEGDFLLESPNQVFTQGNFDKFHLEWQSPTQIRRMVDIDEANMIVAREEYDNTAFYRNLFGVAWLIILSLLCINSNFTSPTTQNGLAAGFLSKNLQDSSTLKPQFSGNFNLNKGTNYNFYVQCNLSETNRDVDYTVTFVNKADNKPVMAIDMSFYTESGQDNEGYWSENLLEDNFKFQVSKTGNYDVFVAPDYDWTSPFVDSSVFITIKETGYSYFYLISGALFLLLWLIFQWRCENIAAYADLNHGTFLHDIVDSMREK